MELLHFNQLPYTNAEDLPWLNVIRVPQEIYQGMFDIAAAKSYSEQSKWAVMQYLEEWLTQKYPNMYMVASVELSNEDARKLQFKFPGLQYGVYVQLIKRDPANRKYDPSNELNLLVYRGIRNLHSGSDTHGAMREPEPSIDKAH